jgi:hypothetical protein
MTRVVARMPPPESCMICHRAQKPDAFLNRLSGDYDRLSTRLAEVHCEGLAISLMSGFWAGDISASSDGERVASAINYPTLSRFLHPFFILFQQRPDAFLSGQVYCVFLFFCAVSLFGTIVAEVNEIVAHLNHEKKSLDEVLEPYLCIKPGSALMLSNPPLAPLSRSH